MSFNDYLEDDYRGWIKFLLYEDLFGHMNHHELLNEYVLHNDFSSYRISLVCESDLG